MAKKKCKKCPECPAGEKWAVPTADFFSLLLALFIALYAIASVNQEKLKAVKEEFVKIYDFASPPDSANPIMQLAPDAKEHDSESSKSQKGDILIEQSSSSASQSNENNEKSNSSSALKSELKELIKKLAAQNSVLEQELGGVLLKLPTSVRFKGSSISFNDDDSFLFLKRMAEIINSLPPYITISIQGHTDDQPLSANSPYLDNMELSVKRAQFVMNELIRNNVSQKQLSIAGFGSTKPLLDNLTEENRANNRRVDFYIFVSNDASKPQSDNASILDKFK